MSTSRIKPHAQAARVYRNRFPQVLGLLLIQLLVRALAFSPLLLALITGNLFGISRDHAPAIAFLLSLPLYVLLAMPLRFQTGARMASLHGVAREDKVNVHNYFRWLPAALLRFVRAIPFVLPFLAFLVAFYYYMRVPGFNESLLAIGTLGELVGGDYPAGIAIVGVVGLLTLVLAACGWKRDLAFEHQPVIETGIRESLRAAKAIKGRRKKWLAAIIRINVLFCLPALLGVLAVLGSYMLSLPRLGMLVMDFLNYVSILLTFSFPDQTLYLLLAVLLVLWLPLLPLRKLALSAVLGKPVPDRQ